MMNRKIFKLGSLIKKKNGATNWVFRSRYKRSMLVLFAFVWTTLNAQKSHLESQQYNSPTIWVAHIDQPIAVDGKLDEEAWNLASIDSTFWLHYPVDTAMAKARTSVRMLYDENNLYFAIIFKDVIDNAVSQSLERDFDGNAGNSDNLTIVLDPSREAKNGYYFGVNAVGAKADGTINQNGMYPTMSKYWNNKWYAETTQSGNSICFEVAIPLNIIKYSKPNNWGINFIRNDVARNQDYSWIKASANKHAFDLASTGILKYKDELKSNKNNKVIIIPSATGTMKKNLLEDNGIEYDLKAGIDAKWALSNSLNLDLSILPEFSNIAVDRQYIDFYQFEYYQPEQRTFFLENSDLFTQFGTYDDYSTPASDSRVKPFYTRRLGMKDGENIPIIYGARLSGQITDKTRVGVLNLQTSQQNEYEAQNYFVGSFHRSILARSTIKGIFTNRNATNNFSMDKEDYNRTGGLEMDYNSKDRRWTANGKLHASYSPGIHTDNLFFGGGFSYFVKNYKTNHAIEHVDNNYITDIGFVPRLYHRNAIEDTILRVGYTHISNRVERYHYLNNRIFIVMGEYAKLNTYLVNKNDLNELSLDIGYWAVFANNYHISLMGTYKKFDLLVPHDVFNNYIPVAPGSYNNRNLFFRFETDRRKTLYFDMRINYGEFYSGFKEDYKFSTVVTFRPHIRIDLSYNLAKIDLVELGKETYHLVGLEPNISFSKNLHWTNLMQLSTQNKRMNYNSLLKWRFAPMSDLYLIYKDDFDETGMNKNYEISIKATYWLNF